MKKSTIFLLISILCLLFTLSAAAHSGRTDSKGGHYDRSTGEYHYHHGYPPHNHYNGECPYEFDDKANIETYDDTDFLDAFFVHYFIFFFVCCAFLGFWLVKFSDLLDSSFLSLNKSIFKTLIGSIIISITSIVFAHIFETKTLNYIIPVIGLFVLSYVLRWPVRKSKYKKYHNKNFFNVYRLVDKKGKYEYQFFEDWCNNETFSGDYYFYTCYVAETSNTIHYKKGCSNATKETYLPISNGKICQKCGKVERKITLNSEKYYKFIDVCNVLKFWDIKPNQKEDNNGNSNKTTERQLPSSGNGGPLW